MWPRGQHFPGLYADFFGTGGMNLGRASTGASKVEGIGLGVEEGFWAGSKEAESRLKDLITAPDMLLEQKGVDPVEVENHLHIVVTSNERWLVPVAADDRRWTIFDVLPDTAERTPENRVYWTRLYADLPG